MSGIESISRQNLPNRSLKYSLLLSIREVSKSGTIELRRPRGLELNGHSLNRGISLG